MFTSFLKLSSLTAVALAAFVLAGSSFAGPQATNRGTANRGTANRGIANRETANRGTANRLTATRFGNSRGIDRNYHLTHGRSFGYGYFYEGRNHYQWTHYTWWSQFGCYTYWCPSTCCYYYWSEPAGCYYPVSYAEVVAPTASTQLLDVRVNNVNTNTNTNVVTTNSPGALPIPMAPRATVASTVGQELPLPTE